MKKAWKIVLVVILIIILLGAICVLIGFFTGADSSRIYDVLNKEYKFVELYNYYMEQIQSYISLLRSADIYIQ